jgi:hypothetical protein
MVDVIIPVAQLRLYTTNLNILVLLQRNTNHRTMTWNFLANRIYLP